ncbi:unnamed protein product [Sphagnum jensenii]|uniref:Uncharacterized protein n=1 Tax=Sphagnum jensenii TaxID=128206 RepID=A0ABP0XF26_9BRYO
MQEDSEELEMERGSRRVEGVRERLLIMEKVESLSHMYLGGLEEVRADVFNVKLRCRDRVDKLEDQWKEFQQQQQETAAASGDELGSVPRQHMAQCRTLLWVKWEDETPTPKVRDLQSAGTPKCLELNRKAQNTSMRGVFGVIGKVLKRRYRKWPRIGHLDICSPSYGQKKGQESNCQFDSRPLKVGNRPSRHPN